MEFCKACGAPLITIYQNGQGTSNVCPECGFSETAENANFSAAYAAAEALMRYQNHEFSAAASGFRKAGAFKYHAPELQWYAMLSDYGIRYFVNEESTLFPTLWRFGIPDIMSGCEEYGSRYADDLKSSENFQKKFDVLKGFLQKVQSAKTGQPYDIFLALTTEENDCPTKEKLFCDEITKLLNTADYNKVRFFYAPKNLEGITVEYFEPLIYHALDSVTVFVLFVSSAQMKQSLSLEWDRIRLRSDVKILIVSNNSIPEFAQYEHVNADSAENTARVIMEICGGGYGTP